MLWGDDLASLLASNDDAVARRKAYDDDALTRIVFTDPLDTIGPYGELPKQEYLQEDAPVASRLMTEALAPRQSSLTFLGSIKEG